MSHSEDLRSRALRYVEQGGSVKEACSLFEVSRSSFQRWRIRKSLTGSLKVKPRTKQPYKIDNEALRNYVMQTPDAYLNEMASHFNVTIPCISIALKRLKITRKKSAASTKNETRLSGQTS